MSGSHTPRPWSLEDRNDGASGYILRGANGDMIEYIERSRYMNDIDDPEQEANARLIAAAPELLEALEALAQKHRNFEQVSAADILAAEEAIAKAKGGAL